MFEVEKEPPSKKPWAVAVVIAALVGVGVLLYTRAQPRPNAPVSVPPADRSKIAPPDPRRDLEVVHATMGKDVTGIRVMWTIQLRNKSAVYTYSDIQYEVRFFSPDGTSVGGSEGTINETIGPSEEKEIPPFIGGMFEERAARFQFLLKGAKASSQ